MKTRKLALISVLLSAVLMLSVVFPASAEATRKEVSAFESSCSNGFEKAWMEGQVMHIRNYIHTNRVVSTDVELNGINTTIAGGQVNLLNGDAMIKGTFSLHPYAINGTWEGDWVQISTNGIQQAWAVGQGTGALSGKKLFLDITMDPSNTDSSFCAGLGLWEGNGWDVGYILVTGQP